MLVDVSPMRERGKALPQHAVQSGPAVHGDLVIGQEKSSALNRYTNIARFQTAGATDPQPLPSLHDAALSWMGPLGFVLTGVEFVDGTAYSQSWWCRPS
jgi:hypothetical protein